MRLSLTLQLLHYYRAIWWSVFLLSALPTIQLAYSFFTASLGANPLQTLQQTTGRWGLIFLLITLSVTPGRQILNKFCIHIHLRYGKRLEDWSWIIRLRRMVGLYCFFYASLHMLVYVLLDLSLDWSWAVSDLQEKPYILLGILAYLMLIPLAITSISTFFHIMGKHNWLLLHKTIYLIVIIVIAHYWWQTKLGVYSYVPYTAATVFLLGYRLFNWLGILHRNPKDDGMEAEPRS